jgi:hypothetical protein
LSPKARREGDRRSSGKKPWINPAETGQAGRSTTEQTITVEIASCRVKRSTGILGIAEGGKQAC